jgi:hypothetical protein
VLSQLVNVTPTQRAALSLPNWETKARNWALVIGLLIAICAGSVRLLTYHRYLPYVDYADEPTYVALADEIRGFSDQTGLRETYGLLAPLYVFTNVAVQSLTDILQPFPWHIPAEYFYSMRLFSVFCGVFTALAITWIGWQLGGLAAAAIGGLIWAWSPIVVDLNSLAIPDPMLYLLCAVAVATGIAAWQKRSIIFLALSLACGIAAIYTKLWLATTVLPFVVVSIAMTLRDRKMLPRIMLLYGIAALFALHFVFVLNPFQNTLKVSANLANGDFFANLFNVSRLLNNLWYLAYPVDDGLGLSLVLLLGGIAALFYLKRNRLNTVGAGSLGILGVYLVSTWWLSAGISNVNIDVHGRMRHVLPVSVAFIPLVGLCLVQMARAGRHFLSSRNVQRQWLPATLISLLLLTIILSFVQKDSQLIERYSHPHTVQKLLEWFDSSPPRDGLVLITKDSKYDALWNRWWGAYAGSKPYEWWFVPINDIPLNTPTEYVARNIRWLVLSDADMVKVKDTQRLQTYLDNLLLVKKIVAEPGRVNGEGFSVYRFEQPEQRVDYDFGGQFRLSGYDFSSTTVRPGDTFRFRPYWRLERQPLQNLSVFVHLYSTDSVAAGAPVLLSQWDGELLPNGGRPTLTWSDTTELYFGDSLALSIPANVAPGNYIIAVGLYDYMSQQRLNGANGDTFYSIPLTVQARTESSVAKFGAK